jgi:thiol:disulfide interchange protein DsbD
MPCVLPIISLKVLQFIQAKDQSRSESFKNGLFFTFGVIFSFWLLAFCMFFLQKIGKTVGWGFQLQEPLFVATLIVILFSLSLGLFGIFEFGTKVAGFAQELEEVVKTEKKKRASLAFCSGVLATFVATPCTGPLLGSTIGFTISLEPILSLAIFTALGFGMAFPYLVLSLFPSLMRLIPRPGRWTVTFKQLMGFFMLATVLWLIWVLESEVTNLSLALLFVSFFLMSLGLWVYGTWCSFDRGKVVRSFGALFALCIFVLGAGLLFYEVYQAKDRMSAPLQREDHEEWISFSQKRLQEFREKREPVFVNVTAKWCLTCQANHLILESEKVQRAFEKYAVHRMVADWTDGDEEITQYIRSLGRNGVPVYAFYGKDPDVPPIILPELLTQDIVINTLKSSEK